MLEPRPQTHGSLSVPAPKPRLDVPRYSVAQPPDGRLLVRAMRHQLSCDNVRERGPKVAGRKQGNTYYARPASNFSSRRRGAAACPSRDCTGPSESCQLASGHELAIWSARVLTPSRLSVRVRLEPLVNRRSTRERTAGAAQTLTRAAPADAAGSSSADGAGIHELLQDYLAGRKPMSSKTGRRQRGEHVRGVEDITT